MPLQRLARLTRAGAGLPGFLRRPLTVQQARQQIQHRLALRGECFLDVARRLIYNQPRSPYYRLLRWAGVELGDLENSVRGQGLDPALVRLRDAGVYLTLGEFRGLTPICRPGLTITAHADDFVNPSAARRAISGVSSGTRSGGTPIAYTWAFLEEEAPGEYLLYHQHSVLDSATAMWMPGPPGIAGIHNLLLHLKTRNVPQRWFSQSPAPRWGEASVNRLALSYVLGCGRLAGIRAPKPVYLPVQQAADLARWMASERTRSRKPAVLKTYASSAVRVAAAAVEQGIDLRGNVVFTGGEALTAQRRRFIESAGLAVHPRYASTEAGMIASACGQSGSGAPDSMHVYTDRLAMIEGSGRFDRDGQELRSLALTTLTVNAPRVLLNTELGDYAVLERRACDCCFGALGLDLIVAHVTSPDKLSGEGMSVAAGDLDRIVGQLVERAGGCPEDYQFWESHDERGVPMVTIAISPAVRNLDEGAFSSQLLERLKASTATELAAQVWREAGSIRLIRSTPKPTAGHKMLPVIRAPDA